MYTISSMCMLAAIPLLTLCQPGCDCNSGPKQTSGSSSSGPSRVGTSSGGGGIGCGQDLVSRTIRSNREDSADSFKTCKAKCQNNKQCTGVGWTDAKGKDSGYGARRGGAASCVYTSEPLTGNQLGTQKKTGSMAWVKCAEECSMVRLASGESPTRVSCEEAQTKVAFRCCKKGSYGRGGTCEARCSGRRVLYRGSQSSTATFAQAKAKCSGEYSLCTVAELQSCAAKGCNGEGDFAFAEKSGGGQSRSGGDDGIDLVLLAVGLAISVVVLGAFAYLVYAYKKKNQGKKEAKRAENTFAQE